MENPFDDPNNAEMLGLSQNQLKVLNAISRKGSRSREVLNNAKKLGAVNLVTTIEELIDLGFVKRTKNQAREVVYLNIR
jgi:DNA-binding MarR family transcriptional regulator